MWPLLCDDAFVRQSGDWLVRCEAGALVAEAGERRVALPTRPFALYGDLVVSLGFPTERWTLGGDARERLPYVADDVVATPQTDGSHLAVAYADHLEVFPVGASTRVNIAGRPVPGEPIALAGANVYWTERRTDTGLDVYTVRAGQAVVHAGGPGDQHFVVADAGGLLAWVDRGAVVVDGRRIAADTGFLSPPSLYRGVACWEDRGRWRARGGALDDPLGIGLRCSDGRTFDRPGHDLGPSFGVRGLAWWNAGITWVEAP